jgi:hypothetical protein
MIWNLSKARTIYERRNQCVHYKRIETDVAAAIAAATTAVGSSQHVDSSK